MQKNNFLLLKKFKNTESAQLCDNTSTSTLHNIRYSRGFEPHVRAHFGRWIFVIPPSELGGRKERRGSKRSL